ncbi:unnamed protein product [Rhizoctonia solani]|uniref:Uncharacterized protein n=1 Tax=Rhizoctonia solani TaxID=456999 RepID=A0A8H3AE77_9AGAM|nr:unnamed protein product [Rhizoctonia solani]
MKSCGSPSHNAMVYSGRPRLPTSPYSRPPPTQRSVSEITSNPYHRNQFDKDQNCATKCPPPRNLGNVLYHGSADLRNNTYLLSSLDAVPFDLSWDPSVPTLAPMPAPILHQGSQSSFSSLPSIEPNNTTSNRSRQPVARRPQGSSSRRPSPDDFRSMILCPREHEAQIHDYVGTDARYTLAKNYAGMMVRSSAKSHDMTTKMHEVSQSLDAIDLFLCFLLEYDGLKSEQKGCLSLRICLGALTALLGDFSQGNHVELSASDPNAPVISKECLPQFRTYNPELTGILRRLSERLEKSTNLYRHRRSPSCSLVAKFQEMSDTLDVWNKHLMDDTFASPSRIASEWLRNHPSQVDNRRRNQAYSEQASPNLSDHSRTSPINYDSNYLSPTIAYAEPTRSSRGNGTDRSFLYESESLFQAGPSATAAGVTYFGSTNIQSGPMPFDPSGGLYRTTSGLGQNLNFSSVTDDFGAFAHQNHSQNMRQYPGAGPGYQGL